MGIRSYAQNFEDVILWRAFHDVEHGRYLDVGAQDPISDSVSFAFYMAGWRGIHVEPTPAYAARLREARPDEIVIEAAVSDTPGPIEFYEISETGLSTGDVSIAESHRATGYESNRIIVPCVRLDHLFELAGTEIHWLKIDVEGLETDVLRSWGDSPRRPWVVVVEATFPCSQRPSHQLWEDELKRRNYREVYFDGLSRYYLHKCNEALAERFVSPPNVFDQFTVTPAHFTAAQIVSDYEGRLESTSSEATRRDAELQQMIEQSQTEAAEAKNTAQAVIAERDEALARAGAVQAQFEAAESQYHASLALAAAERERLSAEANRAADRLAELQQVIEQSRAEAAAAKNTAQAAIAERDEALARAGAVQARFEAAESQYHANLALAAAERARLSAEASKAADRLVDSLRAHREEIDALWRERETTMTALHRAHQENRDYLLERFEEALSSAARDQMELVRVEADRDRYRAELQQALLTMEETRAIADRAGADAAQRLAHLRSEAEHAQMLMHAAATERPGLWQKVGHALGLARPSPAIRALGSWSLPDAQEPITPFPTIPQSEPAMKNEPNDTPDSYVRANSLAELLSWDDIDFVRCAFVTVLGRPPEPSAEYHFTNQIREGHSKREVLWTLRRSPEGRTLDPGIAGFDRALRKAARRRSKWLSLFGTLVRTERDTAKDRRHRARLNEMVLLRMEHAKLNRLLVSALDLLRESSFNSALAPVRESSFNSALDLASTEEDGPVVSGDDPAGQETDVERGSRQRYALSLIEAGIQAQ